MQENESTAGLFERYPALARHIDRIPLGQFPTPVRQLDQLGRAIGVQSLYLKDDGVSGAPFGGNKVRKLEFLLATSQRRNACEVLTFGYAGSNHAAATAAYANAVGMRAVSMLLPQPNAAYVRRNLLLSASLGAELHERSTTAGLGLATARRLLQGRLRHGRIPDVIPPGGSSPLGVLGYINAAFELDEQIARGKLPEPGSIYVALGTTGTAVGLLLGLAAARRGSLIIAVRVADQRWANLRRSKRLFEQTVALLRGFDPSFPQVSFPGDRFLVRGDLLGPGYAHFTEEGAEAVESARTHEGLCLEGTYTGKALAGLIRDARSNRLPEGASLFWNTCNTRSLSPSIVGVDYRTLPQRLWRYFEEDTQPLDRPTTWS